MSMRHPSPRPRRLPAARWLLLPVMAATVVACDGELPDAYGNFESREVTVSSEVTGKLIRFDVREGDELDPDIAVAQIDTLQMALQMSELELQVRASRIRADEARAQVRSLQAQLGSAEEDYERTQRLFDRNAATAGDLNRLAGNVSSLREQIVGARARVDLMQQEAAIAEARIAQLRDRIGRATIRNPVGGTVLTTMVEGGEVVQAGRPLYTIAPLDTLILRAYVSGGQLASLTLGGEVSVQFDAGSGTLERRSGRLTWIASEAEFTPTPIQTREQRVDQVYAVKVLVPNEDRRLKIGMPGELLLTTSGPGGQP
jgi:HlyD family secretion protein